MNPQYVLITEDGDERTSHVSAERIYQAVYQIDSNEYVALQKCRPTALGARAEVFGITYFKDSRMAVSFRVAGSVMRMMTDGVKPEAAADIMCDFFESAKIPELDGWRCEEPVPEQRKDESRLSVDGIDFRFFDFTDVMAALDNIRDRRSRWMLYSITGSKGGYLNIGRKDADSSTDYEVESVRWTNPKPTGFRRLTSDFDTLRQQLWDFALNGKHPEPDESWEHFDVADYFERIIHEFIEE